MRGDIEQQRGKAYERVGAVHGVQDTVVLEADPVEMQPLVFRIFFLLKLVLAEMSECAFAHLVLLQEG